MKQTPQASTSTSTKKREEEEEEGPSHDRNGLLCDGKLLFWQCWLMLINVYDRAQHLNRIIFMLVAWRWSSFFFLSLLFPHLHLLAKSCFPLSLFFIDLIKPERCSKRWITMLKKRKDDEDNNNNKKTSQFFFLSLENKGQKEEVGCCVSYFKYLKYWKNSTTTAQRTFACREMRWPDIDGCEILQGKICV